MTSPPLTDRPTRQPGGVTAWLLMLLPVVGLLVFGTGTASAHTLPDAGNRVRACTPETITAVGVSEHIAAGQDHGPPVSQPRFVVATGVAAEAAADDWPVISGIVRDSAKSKGNFGLGEGTASQATRAGESWVGDGYRVASDGKTLVSRDGLRTFRPPSWKPDLGKYQANFEYWLEERVGKPFGNGHLDITDLGP